MSKDARSGSTLQQFPTVTRAFDRAARHVMRRAQGTRSPFLAEVATRHVYEGRMVVEETPDGEHNTDFMELTSKASVAHTALRQTNVDAVREALEVAGREMADGQSKLAFSTIDKAVREAGTAYNAGGKPMNLDMFIEVLEGIEMDFFTGTPNLSLVCSPDLAKKMDALQHEWMRDPESTRRLNDLMRRKYEQWFARENARKLVD